MSMLLRSGPHSARHGDEDWLFRDLWLELGDGELVALEGESGSGKTTLLRQLAGLDRWAVERRELAGQDLSRAPLPQWRAQVTMLAQDAPMLPATVQDNLDFVFELRAARGRELDRGRQAHLLEALGLGALDLNRPVLKLSGGERHRLALVRGLMWDPPVLLADEPMSGLDPDAAEAAFAELERCAHREGHAVLAIFHDPDLARRADRRVRLSRGALEVVGSCS